jgi:hypothetical protein
MRMPVIADATVAAINVPAGKHILSLRVDRARSRVAVLPNGCLQDAEAADPAELTWRLWLAPTADDKACPVARDMSRAGAHQAQLKAWLDSGAGGAKERPARGDSALASQHELIRSLADGKAATLVCSAATCVLCVLPRPLAALPCPCKNAGPRRRRPPGMHRSVKNLHAWHQVMRWQA